MKTKSYLWTYLFTLAAGVLLIAFAGSREIFKSIVIVLGLMFLVPSAVALIMACLPTEKDKDKTEHVNRLNLIFTSSLGVLFGILLVAIPGFFVEWIVYTLAAILVFCGIAGIIFLRSGELPGASGWFYAMPIATLVAGIIIIFAGAGATEYVICLVTGIILSVYSVNGLAGFLGRRHKGKIALKPTEIKTEDNADASAEKETEDFN